MTVPLAPCRVVVGSPGSATIVGVDFTPPRPAPSSAPAEWLTSRVDVRAERWVTGTAGSGFAAYARIFHPLDDGPNAPRWAEVAARNGRIMHASAQWEGISAGYAPGEQDNGRGDLGEPRHGDLDARALVELCAILTRHTDTPDDCWFAVWDGWGWLHPGAHAVLPATRPGDETAPVNHVRAELQLDSTGAKFSLPARDYLLFGGPVDAAARIGYWVTPNWFEAQSPSIFWPADHAWCVATEVDFDSTLVGGSPELIAEIIASPRLEALPIPADAPYQDTINL